MGIYLYLGLLAFIAMAALWNFRIGEYSIDRILSFICIISFSILSVYFYYTSVNAIDSVNYETRFEYIDSLTVSVDYLFTSFIKFVKRFTKDYQMFRGIIGVSYLFPIILILKKEKKEDLNIPLFLMLCLIFPFFQSIVALRYTMASSVSVSALYLYLKSDQTKKAVIGTTIAILVSSKIHDVTIVYLIIFFLFLFYRKIKNKNIMIFSLLALDFVLIILLRAGRLSGIVNSLIGDTNTFYLGIMETAGLGFIISIFLHVSFVFLLRIAIQRKLDVYSYNDDHDYSNEEQGDTKSEAIDQDIMPMNYCSLILIPMYSINVFSFRLFRGMLVLDFLEISKCYSEKNKDFVLLGLIVLEVICMLFDANGIESIISIMGGGIVHRFLCVNNKNQFVSLRQKSMAWNDHPMLQEGCSA